MYILNKLHYITSKSKPQLSTNYTLNQTKTNLHNKLVTWLNLKYQPKVTNTNIKLSQQTGDNGQTFRSRFLTEKWKTFGKGELNSSVSDKFYKTYFIE